MLVLKTAVTGYTDYTALHLASMKGRIEVVRLLLDAGADPFAVAESGTFGNRKLPIDLAAEHCKGAEGNATNELVCLLKQAMKSRDIFRYIIIARVMCEATDTMVIDLSKEWFGDSL
jgi:ankyrin repeat protein